MDVDVAAMVSVIKLCDVIVDVAAAVSVMELCGMGVDAAAVVSVVKLLHGSGSCCHG